jgi:DNA polymerase
VNRFAPALESVLAGLEAIGDSSDHPPRASISALQTLRAAVPAASPAILQPTRLPLQKNKAAQLEPWRERVSVCLRCPHLAASRTQAVFGVGNPNADLMFIGEAPGADEDRIGEPFVGRAGQLLTRIIETMGFTREQVYIANVLKCRPDMPRGSSGNRPPTPAEMETCLPYLQEQIAIIEPKVLVALGATAVEGLLKVREPMRNLRGQWRSFNATPLMVTYHPAYLLRNQTPSEKRKVWEDMLQVLERLERPITQKQQNYFL